MKQKFPSGFVIKEGNKKAMDAVLLAMTKICMEEVNYRGFLMWIPETEAEFERQMEKYLPSDMAVDMRKSYVNCLREKLKLKYPEGISFTPETQAEFEGYVRTLVDECDKYMH